MTNINSEARRTIRRDLYDRFCGRCAYCKKQIGKKGTIDHYLPKALGGTNEGSNLRWSCFECNNLKGEMHPDEWEERQPLNVPIKQTKVEKKISVLQKIAYFNLSAVSSTR